MVRLYSQEMVSKTHNNLCLMVPMLITQSPCSGWFFLRQPSSIEFRISIVFGIASAHFEASIQLAHGAQGKILEYLIQLSILPHVFGIPNRHWRSGIDHFFFFDCIFPDPQGGKAKLFWICLGAFQMAISSHTRGSICPGGLGHSRFPRLILRQRKGELVD